MPYDIWISCEDRRERLEKERIEEVNLEEHAVKSDTTMVLDRYQN